MQLRVPWEGDKARLGTGEGACRGGFQGQSMLRGGKMSRGRARHWKGEQEEGRFRRRVPGGSRFLCATVGGGQIGWGGQQEAGRLGMGAK